MLSNDLKYQTITFAVVTDGKGVVQEIGKSSVFLPTKKTEKKNGYKKPKKH